MVWYVLYGMISKRYTRIKGISILKEVVVFSKLLKIAGVEHLVQCNCRHWAQPFPQFIMDWMRSEKNV